MILGRLNCSGRSAKCPEMQQGEGLRHILAQVEVSFSNSMIEAFWRSLRHAWLYLHNLDNTATLRRLIAFYVRAHNETMPHAAFNGQTPDEIYFGNGDAVVIDLAAARVRARQERMKAKRIGGLWRVCRRS